MGHTTTKQAVKMWKNLIKLDFCLILVISCIFDKFKVSAVSNVALGKDARQKSTRKHVKDGTVFYENNASLAVDNITQPRSEYKEGGCASTADFGDTDAWWMVDLGSLHVIVKVVVYNRYGSWQRLNNFHLRVGNNSNITSHRECHYYGGIVGQAASATIMCDSGKMLGQFVSIQRTNNQPQGYLQLCEVQVYGYACSLGKYGSGCSEVCHCQNSAVCDILTGMCPGGLCDEIYVGSSCDRRLPRLAGQPAVLTAKDTSLKITFRKFRIGSGSWDEGDGPVSFYRVEYQDQSDSSAGWRQSEDLTYENSQETINYTVSGLKYNTLYNVRVMPYIVHEGVTYRGLPSPAAEGRTRCGDPESVHSIQASYEPQTSGESVTISWQFGSMTGHHCNRYTLVRIIYQQIGSQQKQTKDKQYGDSVNTQLSVSMDRFSSYTITAKTFNDDGLFAESPPFTFTPGGTTTTVKQSLSSPQLNKGTEPQSNSTQDAHNQSGPPTDNTPIIAGVVTALVLIVLIVALAAVLFVRRRRITGKRDPKDKDLTKISENSKTSKHAIANPAFVMESEHKKEEKVKAVPNGRASAASALEVEDDVDTDGEGTIGGTPMPLRKSGEVQENVYSNKPIKKRVIPLATLSAVIADKKQKDEFRDEYKELPVGLTAKCEAGSRPENKNKNRYLNIKAYDHSRVVLSKLDRQPFSDYINANYIDGYEKSKAYVASQGPNKHTVVDFWRMIWEEDMNRIVMVTNTVELTKVKSVEYWPEEGWKDYGDFQVNLINTIKLADHTVRHFTLAKANEKTRTVWQFHFTAWPDKAIPKQATALLAFRQKIRSYDKVATGPMLVHCSAGVGRTGTFIAVDYLLDQLQKEDEVDIFSLVHLLRTQRVNMVQTLDQYIFVHEALQEGMHSGDTTISTPLFREQLEELLEVDPTHGKSRMRRQFQNLESLKQSLESDDMTGLNAENKDRNRDLEIVPGNGARPYITDDDGKHRYINAVYVDGYSEKDAFLVTQLPLPHTVEDLVRLLYEKKISTIAMLNQISDELQECLYWPADKDGEKEIGPFRVKVTEEDKSNDSYMIRTLVIACPERSKSSVTVRQFCLLDWPDDSQVPGNTHGFNQFTEAVARFQEAAAAERKSSSPDQLLVQCLNGADKSGVFCVVYNLMEEIRTNQDVDVFRAVRLVRTNRPQFITSLEQYKFCHDAVVEFLTKFEMYANFQGNQQ